MPKVLENDEEVALGNLDNRVTDQAVTTEEKEVEERTHQMFLLLAGDDLEVDWWELKDILDFAMKSETKGKGFSQDICRSMVALLDKDRSGKLGYQEFKRLWTDIRNWKLAFNLYDKDNSGSLSGFELRQALNSAGYRLNNHILNILVHRFGNKNSELNFDDFILCAVKIKAMIELFKSKDLDKSDTAKFSLMEWIENTLYS